MARVKPMVLMKPGSVDLAQQFAHKINGLLTEGVSAIIEAGRVFIKAKEKPMRHGDWQRMFAGHRDAVADPVRCSVRTAQMIMAVARHPVLSKANPGSFLPESWRTLYELTKVDDAVLTRALEDGRITPAMKRQHVRALRGDLPRPRRTPGGDHFAETERTINLLAHSVFHDLDLEEKGLFVDSLSALVLELGRQLDRLKASRA